MKLHVDEKQERDWFRGKMTERSRLGRARRVFISKEEGRGKQRLARKKCVHEKYRNLI